MRVAMMTEVRMMASASNMYTLITCQICPHGWGTTMWPSEVSHGGRAEEGGAGREREQRIAVR
jgi:hypothetical protein